jgi:Zn-dependent protease with chaperone function
MGELAAAALLAAVAVGSVRGAGALACASWPRRSPALAILLWQALGLAGGLASVGTFVAIGVTGSGRGVAGGVLAMARRLLAGQVAGQGEPHLVVLLQVTFLAAGIALLTVLWWVLVMAFAAVVAARRRQRELLALLAHGDPKAPGALVVDHPAAAAYCLPGIRSKIVVSVGTLDLLAPAELAAVLAHERAHVRARHDLVLIPFASLRRAFPRLRVTAQASRTVALLVEMMADDHALRAMPARELLPSRELAKALLRFSTAGSASAPEGALAVMGTGGAAPGSEITARVSRLLEPPLPLPLAAQASIMLGAGLLVAAVAALLIVPLWLSRRVPSQVSGAPAAGARRAGTVPPRPETVPALTAPPLTPAWAATRDRKARDWSRSPYGTPSPWAAHRQGRWPPPRTRPRRGSS